MCLGTRIDPKKPHISTFGFSASGKMDNLSHYQNLSSVLYGISIPFEIISFPNAGIYPYVNPSTLGCGFYCLLLWFLENSSSTELLFAWVTWFLFSSGWSKSMVKMYLPIIKDYLLTTFLLRFFQKKKKGRDPKIIYHKRSLHFKFSFAFILLCPRIWQPA